MRKIKGEAWDGIATMLVAAFLAWEALRIDMGLWDGRSMSPRFFPLLLSGIIAAFGLMIALRAQFSAQAPPAAAPIPKIVVTLAGRPYALSPPLLLIGMTVAMLLVIKWIGFPIAAALYMFTLLCLLRVEKNRARQSAAIAIGVSLAIFAVFYYGFHISLPMGFGR